MNIIITDTFEKEFKNIFKSESLLLTFSKKLKKVERIKLKHPLEKIKFNFSWISIRWIIFIWIGDNLLPIFIVKKSDKRFWNNLILNKEVQILCKNKLKKCLLDFENDKFKLF